MSVKSQYIGVMSLLVVFSVKCMEVEKSSLMVSASLKDTLKLFHEKNEFSVEHNGVRKSIQPCWVDPVLRKMNSDQLKQFLLNSYIQLKELKGDNGFDYKLDACGRIKGGGPIAGLIGYWGAKAIAYGTISAAASYALSQMPHGRNRAGAATVLRGATYGTGALSGGPGAPFVQDVITHSGHGEHAAMAAGAVITSAGGVAATTGLIETAAVWFGGMLTACPLLP